MEVAYYIVGTLFVIVCLIMIGLVLIQKGRGGGLSGAFGGGGGGNTAFGAKTGDVLTWATAVVFALFITLAVTLNLVANRMNNDARAAAMGSAGGTGTNSAPTTTPAQ